MDQAHHPSAGTYLIVYVLLIGLLVVTVAASFVDVGWANFVIAALIATTKAVLIVLFFMHARYSPPLIWIVAVASVFWLALLFGFTLSDYVTRNWIVRLP